MRRLSLCVLLVFLCGCGGMGQYNNLCNALICNPDMEGKTTEQLVDDFGVPTAKEIVGDEEIWTYEVSPLYRYGSKGKIMVTVEDNVVTESTFLPAKTGSREP